MNPAQRAADPVGRALGRLAGPGMALMEALGGRGGFGVFPGGDRRRRPLARLTGEQVRALEADGALTRRDGGGFVLSAAGAARAARIAANPDERFLAQHGPLVERPVMAPDGAIRSARGYFPHPVVLRLERMRDGEGAPWFSREEIAAARCLRADWEAGQAGLLPGSDWTAAPRSAQARGPGNGREGAMAAGMDARARVNASLGRLCVQQRRIVEALCLNEMGLEEFETAERWPARSGKIALKLALAQLSLAYARA
ncbi:MAG: hypothetical protein JNJ73_00355 [Hyphomonadaceae bacterium]|nr:hypothetical protein [Hyphomonadaceae bacterium]